MSTVLDIDQMTLEEKLRAMEALWDDLCRKNAVPVPQWHKDILDERERQIEAGKAEFIDWDIAKRRITERSS
ncbi:MAG TPA: addiction module protein [Pyrinomonadaceae bacterium]|nr:addiction module protein [Pyrinomonadaceae bacterium]